MNASGKIPQSLYRKIHQVLPVVTVDLVVRNGREFLLVKRTNNPKANTWYFPGGRILKDEKIEKAGARKLREETGLIGRNWKFLGFHQHFYNPKRSYFPGFGSHVISLVFQVDVKGDQKIILDSQSSNSHWFKKSQQSFDSYHRKFLRLAGFK